MGDRANICVKDEAHDNGVFLYTHWDGSVLPQTLQNALKKKERWDDTPYLTRIIFDQMTENNHGGTLGFGISSYACDGDHRVIYVDVRAQTVSRKKYTFTFEQFVSMDVSEFWAITS